jgi:hypothetical protein
LYTLRRYKASRSGGWRTGEQYYYIRDQEAVRLSTLQEMQLKLTTNGIQPRSAVATVGYIHVHATSAVHAWYNYATLGFLSLFLSL